MYSTSTDDTPRGVGAVIDLALSHVPGRSRHWGPADSLQKVQEKSFIENRVEYVLGTSRPYTLYRHYSGVRQEMFFWIERTTNEWRGRCSRGRPGREAMGYGAIP
jgi:hypothetical protein